MNRGQGQQAEQTARRRREKQPWTDSSAKLTPMENLMKRHENSLQNPPCVHTSNGLHSLAPEHAAEAQATTGSRDARRFESLAPTRTMPPVPDIELALDGTRGSRALPSDLRLLQGSGTMPR